MHELTTIGDYAVRPIERAGPVVRYAATHVVLPRRAIIELLEPDASRLDAMKLMRRACILEALQHPAVPRVYECGRLDGRPWIAIAHEDGLTLHDELLERRLEVRDVLTLVEELASFLAHAHARGVRHGAITPKAIVRAPVLRLQRWENALAHDTELASDALDARDDVFELGRTIALALAGGGRGPDALTRLVLRMLSADPAMRPTPHEIAASARALRSDIFIGELAFSPEALARDDEGLEIVVEYPEEDDEPILLDRRRSVATSHVHA